PGFVPRRSGTLASAPPHRAVSCSCSPAGPRPTNQAWPPESPPTFLVPRWLTCRPDGRAPRFATPAPRHLIVLRCREGELRTRGSSLRTAPPSVAAVLSSHHTTTG